MNDLELYIYIALAAIYFLSRAFRKKKTPQPPLRRQGTSTPRSKDAGDYSDRPITFEDLLREFTGQREISTGQERADEHRDQETVVSEEDRYMDTEEEMVAGYDTTYENTYPSYEDVYGQGEHLKTLDEQVSLNDPQKKRFERYKVKEDENIHVAQRYRDMLKDAVGVRDAIILKEILDRKYF